MIKWARNPLVFLSVHLCLSLGALWSFADYHWIHCYWSRCMYRYRPQHRAVWTHPQPAAFSWNMNSWSTLLLFSGSCPLVHVYINYSTWPAVRTILKFNFMPKSLLDTTLQQNRKFRKNINPDFSNLPEHTCPHHHCICGMVRTPVSRLRFSGNWLLDANAYVWWWWPFRVYSTRRKKSVWNFRLYIKDRYFGLRPKFVFSGLSLHLTTYSWTRNYWIYCWFHNERGHTLKCTRKWEPLAFAAEIKKQKYLY